MAIKAAVVAGDEREAPAARPGGRRAQLRPHPRPRAGDRRRFDLRHGEAVAIGLVFAAELAAALERIDADRVAEHRRVVAGYGLPDRLPPGVDARRAASQLMGRDKKARGGLTFVLDGPAGVEPVTGVDPRAAIDGAFAALDGAAGGTGA